MDHLTTTSAARDALDNRFRVHERARNERLFKAAVRHSRFVRFMRLAIPAVIVLMLATIMVATFFNPFRDLATFPLDPGRLLISGTKITMQAPRLGGFTRDGRAYELTASTAAQDLTKPDVLELKDIQARVSMQDQDVVEMRAATGVYETKRDLLHLEKEIVFRTASGYAAQLTQASIDIKKGALISEKPVEVKMSNGTVTSNRLEVVEHGNVIRFDGDVEVNVMLGSAPRADEGQAKAVQP